MKILNFKAENVKKLSVVEITPTGNLVEVSGRNGNGKSSVLDSIWWALAGARNIQTDPIRHGQETATIQLDLGSLKVTRKFKRKDGAYTTSLTLENADGSVPPGGAQTILNALLGALTFDPSVFDRMDAPEQFNTLRKFVSDVDFEKIDALNRGEFNRRAEINKKLDEAKFAAEAIMVPPEPAADYEVRQNDSEIRAKIASAGAHEQDRQRQLAHRDSLKRQIEGTRDNYLTCEATIKSLELQLELERTRLTALRDKAADLAQSIDALAAIPDRIDTASLMTQLNEIDTHNRSVEQEERNYAAAVAKRTDILECKQSLTREYHRQMQASAELTLSMKKRTEAKEAAIAAAKMPVDGLGFGDGFVTFNGVPLDQASGAERTRVSMSIAIALAPKLRVILIRNGNDLDEESWEIVRKMAKDSAIQIWVETVHKMSSAAVVIEDGQVRHAQETAEATA